MPGALILILGASAIAVTVAVRTGVTRPELRALALRNLRRRPARVFLVATGVLLATATLASAAIVGDSLRASIRRSAVTQLGPVDEEVIGSGTHTARSIASGIDRAHLAGVDGVLPLLSLTTTVRGRDFVARVAQAQLIEVDFMAAAAFGGDAAATGISGATPSGTDAVMSADLSHEISIGVGHRVTIYAYGGSRTFRIVRVLPRLGLAGLQPSLASAGSVSPNLFVPLGTIAAMRSESRQVGGAEPTAMVAVSNRGGVITSRLTSDATTSALRQATSAYPVDVVPVKQLLLDDAARRSNTFEGDFRVFGALSVLGGVLLLLLTLGGLASERARTLGILRALGLRRREIAATLVLEGLPCCIVGALAGAALGAGIAVLVILLARRLFANAAAGEIELIFAAQSASLVFAAAIGLLAALTVLIATSLVVSHGDVVALIRAEIHTSRRFDRSHARVLGAVVFGAGIAVATLGSVASNSVAAVLGAAGAVIGAAIGAGRRSATTVAAVGATALVIWTMIEVGHRHSTGSATAPATLLSAGAVMSLAGVALVRLADHASALRHHPGGGRRTPSVSLGHAYSRAAPTQTAAVCAMYAVVVFTVCFAVIVGRVYAGSVDRVARQLGGSAALEVTSNSAQPVAATDVAQLSGVTNVTQASALKVRIQESGDLVNDAELIGFDSSFIGHGTPPLIAVTPGGPTSSLYRRVLADPTLVVVGVDFNATAQNSLDHRAPRVGDQLQLEDRTTGATRVVRIAALVANARYQGADHIYGSDALAAALRGPVVARNVLYVETRPGTNNDTLAAIIDGTHLPNGAYARSFRRLASDLLRARQQFLNILAGYAALALIAGALTLAVAMAARVRERRHQLATLRAIGLHPKTLRRALRFEAVIIGLEATLAGALAAALLGWRVATAGALGEPLTLTLPWATLAIIIITVLFGAAAATTLAARQAGRLQPASALRADE